MFEGYSLRKYDWKDWLLMVCSSAIILQVVMMVLLSVVVPIAVGNITEATVNMVTNYSVVYGSILSLPLSLYIIYKRKIPLFNRKQLSEQESFLVRGLTKEDWKFLIKYIPVSYILFLLGSVVVEKIFGMSEAANQMAVESLFNHVPPWQLFLMIVIVAPITEELLFRGLILFPGNRLDTSWVRVIISSLLFGLIHILTDVDVYTFYTYVGMGFIFTYAAKRTNSIEASIVYHMLNNLLGFFAILLIN